MRKKIDFDAWVAEGLRLLVGAALVVSGFALILVVGNAAPGTRLAATGQLGDTVGGLSNFVTMLVVIASALYATKEVDRARKGRMGEMQLSVAREIWGTVAHQMRQRELDLAVIRDFKTPTRTNDNALERALDDAELILQDDELEGALRALCKLDAEVALIQTDLEAKKYQPGSRELLTHAHRAISMGTELREAHRTTKSAIRRVLKLYT